MKFKAKPKLTPERLRRKIKLKNARLVRDPIINICWSEESVSYLIASINEIVGHTGKSKSKIETYCDADFY
jgi:hypothetical protein